MTSLLDKLADLFGSDDEGYEVEEYVLERREPDPNPRVKTYDERVSPSDVEDDDGLPSGTYLLQEIKTTGTAGEVVWEEELTFRGEDG